MWRIHLKGVAYTSKGPGQDCGDASQNSLSKNNTYFWPLSNVTINQDTQKLISSYFLCLVPIREELWQGSCSQTNGQTDRYTYTDDQNNLLGGD